MFCFINESKLGCLDLDLTWVDEVQEQEEEVVVVDRDYGEVFR